MEKKNKNNRIISRDFFKKTLIVSFSITLILSIVYIVVNYNSKMKNYDKSLNRIKEADLMPIAQAMWNFDIKQLVEQLNSLKSYSHILSLTVFDKKEKVFVGVSKKNIENINYKSTINLPVMYLVNKVNTKIGRIELVTTKNYIIEEIKNGFMLFLIFQFIQIFLIALFIRFIFNYSVGSKIEYLERSMNKIDLENPKHINLEKFNSIKPNELVNLGNSVNNLISRLNGFVKLNIDKIIKNEQKLVKTQQAAKISNWKYDIKKNIIYTAEGSFFNFDIGLQMQSMYFNDFKSKLTEGDRDSLERQILRCVRIKGIFSTEFKVQSVEGELQWLRMSGESVVDENNNIKYLEGIIQNITESKQSEIIRIALGKLRDKYAKIKDDSNELFEDLLNITLNFSKFKHSFIACVEDIESSDKENKVKLNIKAHSTNISKGILDNINNIQYALEQTVQSRSSYICNDLESCFIKPNSEKIEIKSYTLMPIIIDNNVKAVICFLNIKNDIQESEIEEFTKVLESISYIMQIILSNRKLNEQELISAQNSKLASIGELAAGVGHEINNPLAISLGFLDKVTKQLNSNNYTDKTIYGFLDKMHNSHIRIKDIVSGLRTFAKSDSITSEILSVENIVYNTIGLIKEIFDKDGVNINVNNETSNIHIEGIYGKIQQILMNLLNNARDATAHRVDRNIDVSIYKVADQVCIEVKDNGEGIAKKNLKKIFETFYTTKDVGKGTGLGLPICKNIINNMHGELFVESELNKYTKFKVMLPISNITKLAAPAVTGVVQASECITGVGKKILIVDDEEDLREILRDILEEFEYEVTEAEDGIVALELIKSNSYDAVITDIKMPRKDGIELINDISSLNLKSQLRVIVATGGVSGKATILEDSEFAKLYHSYVLKPYDDDEIIECLNRAA